MSMGATVRLGRWKGPGADKAPCDRGELNDHREYEPLEHERTPRRSEVALIRVRRPSLLCCFAYHLVSRLFERSKRLVATVGVAALPVVETFVHSKSAVRAAERVSKSA